MTIGIIFCEFVEIIFLKSLLVICILKYHYFIIQMRKQYSEAFQSLPDISKHKQILQTTPSTPQQLFLQTIMHLPLCLSKQVTHNPIPLLNAYKGAFSNTVLSFRYGTLCMEKGQLKSIHNFTLFKMLEKWIVTFQAAKKKKQVRLHSLVLQSLVMNICTYEQFIACINYVSNDLMTLIRQGNQQIKKKHPDLSQHPHLDASDLVQFLSIALPKVLTNMTVPRNFFPATLLKSTQPQVSILYSNQNLENIAQNRTHYNLLIRQIIKILLSMQLQSNEVKQLVLSSFRYYYLYHFDKNCSASQFVIQSLKKMNTATRYAICDQIALFVIILKKLGKQLFVNYLVQKFQWMQQLMQTTQVEGISKASVRPFFNQSFNNSLKINIAARNIQHYYLEVYDHFSLLFFFINCADLDISIRFYYLGAFDKSEGANEKKLLFTSEKKEGVLEASLQLVEPGIYQFQFDNSYSWMKGKSLNIDLTLYSPLQVKKQMQSKVKSMIYQKCQNLNDVPFENVIGWVEQKQIQITSTSANVSMKIEGNIKVYNLRLVKNTGQEYEYQTESKYRFLEKVKHVGNSPNVFWVIKGFKVKGPEQVGLWLDGEFEPESTLAMPEKSVKEEEEIQEQIVKKEKDQVEQKVEKEQQKQSVKVQVQSLANNEQKQKQIQKQTQKTEQKTQVQSAQPQKQSQKIQSSTPQQIQPPTP